MGHVAPLGPLLAYSAYEERVNYVVLGSGPSARVLRQIRGTAMGGRFSKFKCSVLMGKREGAFIRDVEKQNCLKFAIPGFQLHELFSMLRYIDDANPCSLVWCQDCIHDLLKEMWGVDLDISQEETADGEQALHFLDTKEVFHNGAFYLRPYDKLSVVEIQKTENPISRFVPAPFNGSPLRDIRSLVIGRLARTEQIIGDEQCFEAEGVRMVWSLLVDLTDSSRSYTWPTIVKALAGSRNARFRRVLAKVRSAATVMTLLGGAA